jgi:hypothetical protein
VDGPTNVFIAFIVVGMPILMIIFYMRSYYRYKEKQLDAETTLAAEKAAQYAANNAELEQRIRVLEQIVTDGGMQTAAQIEALRDKPAALTETKQ